MLRSRIASLLSLLSLILVLQALIPVSSYGQSSNTAAQKKTLTKEAKREAQALTARDAALKRISKLIDDQKTAEAIRVWEKYVVEVKRRDGEEHLRYVEAITKLAELYDRTGWDASEPKRDMEAEPLLNRALEIQERILPLDHPDIATTLAALSLTACRRDFADFRYTGESRDVVARLNRCAPKEEALLKRALEIREKGVPRDDIGIEWILHRLSRLYTHWDKLDQSELVEKRFLTSRELRLGPDHADVRWVLQGLCDTYTWQTRYVDAVECRKRVLHSIEKEFGPDKDLDANMSEELSQSVTALAEVYELLGRYADAEPLYERALKLAGTSDATANLASIYLLRGSYTEAEKLVKRWLVREEEKYEKEKKERESKKKNRILELFSQMARVGEQGLERPLHLLGQLYAAQGRFAEAEPLYKRAMTVREEGYGPEDEVVGMILFGLALAVYVPQERFVDAEQLTERGIAIISKDAKVEKLALMAVLTAVLKTSQGNYADAEPRLKDSLATLERKFGPDHVLVGGVLHLLALLHHKTGRSEEAEKLYNRTLAIHEKALGADHPTIPGVLNNMAELYESQTRFIEAEAFYLRALHVLQTILLQDHPIAATIRENLGGMYKSLGRRGEAEPLLKRALMSKEKVFGAEHPSLAKSLTLLADLHRLQGQCDEAEPLFVRALTIGKGELEEVAVLFATDRKRDSSQTAIAFGGERDQELSFGLAIATVPKEQTQAPLRLLKDGSVGGGAVEARSERRLALRCVELVNDKKLIEAAVRRLSLSKTFPEQVFVFVHGYNVSFDNAVRRAAQIAYDLKFDGGTFLFSWPSLGQLNVRAYFSDRETVDIAAEHLRLFLEKVVAETKARKIHFVAHSMGNLVLLRALEKVGSEAPHLRPVIGEIIQAAPDVDTAVFKQLVTKIKAWGSNLTLYASAQDKALWLSGWLRKGSRAGFISENKPLVVAGVDTIDITSAGTGLFGLNHDIYLASPTVVEDMRRIFQHGERPPDKRTKELEPMTTKEGVYWRLRPSQTGVQ